MLETSRLCQAPWWAALGLVVAACTLGPREAAPTPAVPAAAAPAAVPAPDEAALAEEARAMLAQAETDVQRARAKRALWLKAWEDLLAARREVAAHDNAAAIESAKRASELAQLGLEQLAYPAVR
ncbi:MAG TPA: hypothetical protein VHP55_00205 [Usitatibacter sp.]|jgi:hypothetical protein|nr:hypothetical protein [Usitatibacter sp.]